MIAKAVTTGPKRPVIGEDEKRFENVAEVLSLAIASVTRIFEVSCGVGCNEAT